MPEQATKREGGLERLILIGMITSDAVTAGLYGQWGPGMFEASWANLVGRWCIDHYDAHARAPGRSITGHFQRWYDKNSQSPSAHLVETFLGTLSDEYEQSEPLQPEHVLKLACEYFNRVRLGRMADDIKEALAQRDVPRAQKIHADYRPLTTGLGSAIDLLIDKGAVYSTFDSRFDEPLLEYPGALGQFFTNTLVRDSMVGLLAGEKMGKSLILLDMAYQALLARRRVVYFEAGDLSERQVKLRFLTRFSLHPIRSSDGQWPTKVYFPEEIQPRAKATDRIVLRGEEFLCDRPLNAELAWEKCKEFMKHTLRTDENYFKISPHANSTLGVPAMKAVLKQWADADGWRPDVIVVDYADILICAGSNKMDRRDQIDTIWKQLRALSQETSTLVLTATQARREAHKRATLDREDVSEDKRKTGHVTAFFAVAQSREERKHNVRRFNWFAGRDIGYDTTRCVSVVGCDAVASPCMASAWPAREMEED